MPTDLFRDGFHKFFRKDVVRDITPDALLAKTFFLTIVNQLIANCSERSCNSSAFPRVR